MQLLCLASRWIFFAALFVPPWLYGGTTATGIVITNWILAAAVVAWLLELVLNRRKPDLPLPLLLLCAALALIGLWMTFNAKAIYDQDFGTFAIIEHPVAQAPGSLDYALSAASMIRVVLLLLSILFVVDLVQDDKALLQLWAVIALSGGSIALLGLVQKATGAQTIFWQTPSVGYTQNFFATYYYHANAGAYLNLILPFTAGLALRAFGTRSGAGLRTLWLTTFLLGLGAAAANTSRMAHATAFLILIALVVRFGPRIVRDLSRSEKNVMLAGAAAVLFMMFAIGRASHLERPLKRWENIGEHVSADARWSASRIAAQSLSDAGLIGFGPGTFRAIFPSINAGADHPVPGEWRFLHQDYLQTALEWGWLGSALWAALFFGGIGVSINTLRKPEAREWRWRRRVILPMSIFALFGVALHALVDFPWQIASIQLYSATCLGLCWGSARWRSR